MATFPSAALQIQQPPSVVDQTAKLLSLKSMLQQQQLQQTQLAGEQQRQGITAQLAPSQIQEAQTQAQMGQIQLANQQRLQQALAAGPIDFQKPGALDGFIQQGGPAAIPLVAQLTDIASKQASTSSTLLAEHIKKLDQYRGQLMSAVSNPDATAKQSAWKQSVDSAVASGDLQPGQIPDVYPGDQKATALANTLALGSALATEQAQQTRANAAQSEANTAATRLKTETPGIVAAAQINQQKASAGLQGTAAAQAAGTIHGQMQAMGTSIAPVPATAPANVTTALPGAQITVAPIPGTIGGGVATGRNDAVLQQLQQVNPGMAAIVKALDEGRYQVPSAFALKSPYWQGIMQKVAQYDPGFDQVNYNSRAAVRRDFTSGTAAKQVNALNTAIGHLSQLSQAVDALGNVSLTPVNSIKNWLSQKAGDPKVTNFQAVVKPVADELTRVWRGTGGSEADIENRLNALSSSNSPQQLHGAIQQLGELMKSKIGALQNQYEQGMGIQGVNMLTPEADQTLQRLEGKGGPAGGVPRAPSGFVTMRGPDGTIAHVPQGSVAAAKAAGAVVVNQ